MDIPKTPVGQLIAAGTGPSPSFMNARVLQKRTGTWAGGRAILLDRQPHSSRTEFKHCLKRHAVSLHLEGANTRTEVRYDGGPEVVTGSTLGQVTLLPAEHPLEGWSDYPSKVRHIVVLIEPAVIEDAAHENSGVGSFQLPYEPDLNDGTIINNLRALQAELDNPGLLGRLYVESLSSEIAIRIVRKHSPKLAKPQRGGLSPFRLRKVQDYIEANLSREITLADLAAIAGASTAHFCRAFHKSVGLPSHQYIIRRRTELAKRLLAEAEMPIAEIALAVGFGNQSHLTKHFHRVVGTTPWRFRQQA
jgi:AraC family transcriptional regulator